MGPRGDWRYVPMSYPGGLQKLDLPKTAVMVAGMDPLRDDGILYERVLREECGVPTKLYVYPGLPHGFGVFPTLKASQKQVADSIEAIGWMLS